MVETLLRAGADVIVDDTNLRSRTYGTGPGGGPLDAAFEVHDFTDVPLEECLRRDADRPEDERVGEEGIRRMHATVPGRAHAAPARPPALNLQRPAAVRGRSTFPRSWSCGCARIRMKGT